MRIAFNPSTVAALTTPPNNKDITFDLRGRNIFARGVKFQGTDTNTWRPVVDSLTSDSTTSSLSAKQGKILAGLINNKSDSGHNHDDRYIKKVGGIPTSAYDLIITPTNLSGDGYVDVGGGIHVKAHTGTPFQLWLHDISNVWYKKTGDGAWKKMDAGYADIAGSVAWANVTGKPSSYTPSAHTHAWNSLTHSSTTANQAILTNGSVNGWKLYTLNISAWDNAANNAHSHSNKAILDGITSALVSSWNTAYNFVDKITKADTDKVINKWDEIVNFLAGIDSNNKLNTLLNSKLSIQQLAANDILTTKTNNALFWVNTVGTAGNIPTGPFTDHPYALLSVTNYSQNDTNGKFFYRSRLAFSSIGDIKVASCHHQNEYKQDETWYNVLTSKNSGISGSTIKLNGTSITVYSSGTADGRYVKKSGDTMSGALNFANGTWNLVGDDSYMGDCNISGHFGIKAANTTYPGIAFFNNANTYLGKLTAYSGNIKYGSYSLQFLDNGNTSVSASTWTNPFSAYDENAVENGQAICVWGQSSYLSNLSTGTGDMTLWLKRVNANFASLNMVLDGEYYASGNQRLAHVSEIPSSLKNPYALTISLNGTSQGPYDGSAAKSINITAASIGAATSGHNHDERYLALSGGWMTGDINFGRDSRICWARNTDSASISFKNDGDADYDSYMSFVTSDNGNEYFRWSHNSASTNTEWMSLKGDGLRVRGTKVSLEGHTHDDRYLKLTGGTMTGTIYRRSGGATINGRDTAIIRQTYAPGGSSWNPIACVDTETGTWTLGHLSQGSSNTDFSFCFSTNADYNAGNNNGNYVFLRNKAGIIALTSEIPNKNSWNYDDRYYTKAESNAKYITDIITSVNKLTFTKNGSNIDRTITVNNVQSLGRRSPLTERNAISGIYTYGTYSNENNLAPVSYFETLGFGEGTAGAIEIGGSWISGGQLYWRALRDVLDNWFSWKTILDSSNYSDILDSRYYTESEVNSLLAKKLDRVNLTTGSWNPRGYSLAAAYNYSGGDISLSVNGGQMHVSVDGKFWQNEGQYRVLDTSDVAGLKGDLTIHQYLSATDATWRPLIWGGSSHANTSDSTGAVYKSHDKLSWQTSSQTLYATKLRTTNLDTQTAFFHPGNDSTLKIYSGITQDAVSDGHIGLQTSIDNTDGQTHVYPTQYGSRCVLALQPRGGSVYIGNMPNGGNGRKLNVNGDIGLFNTGSIRDLAIGGGIYWNPYVESAGDGSDAASITLVKSGVAGGTTLVLSQMNDSNDTIQFQTNGSARLYHNSNQILTSGDTKVSSGKGYINNTEITQVNNSDTLDGKHADKYIMVPTTIDASTLDVNTYYPVTIWLPTKNTRIEVEVSLDSGTKPSWSTHNSGFTTRKVWESNGSGWGTTSIERNIFVSVYSFASEDPVRGIGQLTKSSIEYVYVRGGGKYFFKVSVGSGTPTLQKATYTINDQSIAPTKTAPALITPCINTPHKNVTLWGQNFNGTNNVSGSLINTGTITPAAANVYNIGTSGNFYNTIYSRVLCGETSNTSVYHQIAIGYPGHDRMDFDEYGGAFYFNKTSSASRYTVATITSGGLYTTNTVTYGLNGLQYFNQVTGTTSGATNNANPYNDWFHIIRMNHGNGSGYFVDLATAFHQDAMYFRRIVGGHDKGWRKILHDGNSSISGDTITINGSSLTVSKSDHNHDGRYVRFYTVTSLDCNNLSQGLTAARTNATNAAHSNHSAFLYISDVGTPFQLQIPDSSVPYIYKRCAVPGGWSGWFKLSAGYADSAGNADTVDGKHASDFASSSHNHDGRYAISENYGGFTRTGRLPISGFYQSYESTSGGNAPWVSWMHLINCQHNNTDNNYALQIAASFYDNNTFKIRVTNDNVNNAWRDIIHSGNIGAQSVNYANSAGNADKVDGYHATDGRTFNGDINWGSWNDAWSDGTHAHPWYGFDHRYPNTGAYSTTITDYFGMTIKTANTLRLDFSTLLLNGTSIYDINVASATNAYHLRINSANSWSTWNWSGQGGQPTWLWGSNDGTNMYVWNPSNFSVNYANSAGSATKVIVNQHTANDINYPLVWSNQSDTNSATENQLFKSWADLYYNPKNKRLCVAGSAIIGASAVPSYTLDVRGNIIADTWLRTRGEGGWYSESYGGGIWMWDTSWIRTYGNKGFYCDRQIYSSNSIRMSDIYLQNTNEINNGANGLLHLNYRNTGNVTICNGGGKVGIGKSDPLYTLDVAGNGRFQDFVYCNAVYSTALNHTSSTGHLVIGNKTKEISIRSSNLPDLNALYLYQKFSTNVYYSANKGFGIRPYYLSNAGSNVLPTETVYNNKYLVLTVGDEVQAISCIIADKTPLISGVKGTLIRFMPGDDGQIVLLKDLNNYGVGSNGYFWVQPKGCSIVRSDNSNVYIADGNISSSYDDGGARFFIYAKTHKVWIEFFCG